MSSTAKKADSRGRLHLGDSFAGKMFIVNELENGDVLIKRAAVIPASEKWLYDNNTALTSVKRGLEQAAAKQFVTSPQESEDTSWIADLLEDEE